MSFLNSRYLVLVAALLGLTGCTKNAADYITAGNADFEKKQYDDAVLAYRKALQKDPRSGEASFRLAMTYMRQSKTPEAYAQLRQTVATDATHAKAAAQLADLTIAAYLSTGGRDKNLYDSAVKLIEQLRKRDPESADAHRLQGHLYQTERKLDEAEASFRRAAAARPKNPDILTGLAQTLIMKNQPAEAEKVAQDVIAAAKDYQPIYTLIAENHRNNGNLEGYERILKLCVANNPQSGAKATELASFYLRSNRPDDAKAQLEKIMATPSLEHRHGVAGDVWMAVNSPEKALEYYRKGLSAEADSKQFYRKKSVNALVRMARADDAEKMLAEILAAEPNDRDARMIRAALWADSADSKVRQKAIPEYKELLKQSPNDPSLHYKLGDLMARQGDSSGAKSSFTAAIEKQPTYLEAHLRLAELARNERRFKDVLQHSERALAIQPDNPPAQLFRAVAQTGLGQESEARVAIEKLALQHPNAREVQIELAASYVRGGRYREAEAITRRAYNPSAGDKRALAVLVDSLLGQKRGSDATQLVNKELGLAPASVEVRSLVAKTALSTGDLITAEKHFQSLAGEFPKEPFFHKNLAQVQATKGDLEAALASYRKVAEVSPDDANAVAMVAFVEEQIGQKQQALKNYKASLVKAPQDPLLMNNMAYTLADLGTELDEALRLAQVATRKDPDNPYFADTLGFVYIKRNNLDSAVRIFSDLIKQYPNVVPFRYHYAVALNKKGDNTAAKAQLNAALSRKPAKKEAEQITELLKKIS